MQLIEMYAQKKLEKAQKEVSYNGSTFYKDIDFNLYPHDDIDISESKDNILSEFKNDYFDTISVELEKAGLELIDMVYYSPTYYNYGGDSIDPTIKVSSLSKLYTFIKENREGIQKALDDNKSYDGYMSMTPNNIDDIDINNLIIVIEYIYNSIDFSDFYMYDSFVYDDLSDNED